MYICFADRMCDTGKTAKHHILSYKFRCNEIYMGGWLLIFYNTMRSKKRKIWKSGVFCFISKVSNDSQKINCITLENLVHCGFFLNKRFSDIQMHTEIWLVDQLG